MEKQNYQTLLYVARSDMRLLLRIKSLFKLLLFSILKHIAPFFDSHRQINLVLR